MDINKKQVMVAVILICLILVVGITLITRESDRESIVKGEMQMLCANSECSAEYELSLEKYSDLIRGKNTLGSAGGGSSPLTCPKCGEESAYSAIKCKKCNIVFYPDLTTKGYPDRCPECGYSDIEEERKK